MDAFTSFAEMENGMETMKKTRSTTDFNWKN